MKIAKVTRRKSGDSGSSLNAVVAANVGEMDSDTVAGSRQDIRIVQRDGHTQVLENTRDEMR